MKNSRKAFNKMAKQIIKHYLEEVSVESIAKFLDVSHEYVCNVIDIFHDLTGPDLENLCKELGFKEDNIKRAESEDETGDTEKSASGKRNKKAPVAKQNNTKRIKLDTCTNSARSLQHSSFIKELSILTNLYRYMANSQKSRPFLMYRTLSYLLKPKKKSTTKIAEIMDKLSLDVKKLNRLSNPLESPLDWPQELYINLDRLYESPKESDWSTVSAQCEIFCRFGYCWRQKGFSNDSIIKIHENPININCNSNEDKLANKSVKINIKELLEQARNAGNRRIRSAHLEIHIIANEKKKNITAISDKSSYKVQYVTAPLPIFTENPSSYGDVEVCQGPFLLTPGSYELRLGLDTDDYLHQNDIILEKNEEDHVSKRTRKATEINSVSVNGAGSGRIDWITSLAGLRQGLAVDEYERWPTIHFDIKWTKAASPEIFNGDSPKTRKPRKVVTPKSNGKKTGKPASTELISASHNQSGHNGKSEASGSILVTYKFLYEGNCQQWAESKDLVCPWCRFNAHDSNISQAQAFLHHLRAFHSRFQFKATLNVTKSLLNIEVSFKRNEDCNNDCGLRRWMPIESAVVSNRRDTDGRVIGGWDGLGNISSQIYDGSGPLRPKNSVAFIHGAIQESYAFTPSCLGDGVNSTIYSLSRGYSRVKKPVKRIPFSELVYCKQFDSIFKGEADEPTMSIRQLGTGHDRTYYHTWNCQPIRTCEFDYDSENEEEVSYWLKANYIRNIEEFTDVNRGEKYLFEMWNEFLLSIPTSHLVMADGQMTRIVLLFIDHSHRDIKRLDLRYNLITHLVNLVDYGLLSNTMLIVALLRYDEKCSISTSMGKDEGALVPPVISANGDCQN